MCPRGSKRSACMFLLAAALGLAALPAQAQTSSGLKIQCYQGQVAPNDNQISVRINIVNGSTATVALSNLTARYWYTEDGTASQNYFCDWTQRGCTNVTGSFGQLSPATTTADGYLQIGFSSGMGSLSAGQNTGEIQGRVHKSDWSNYNEANDYSYVTNTSMADCPNITLYNSGTLVWGTPPNGGTTGPDTAPPTAPSGLTASGVTSNSVTLSWAASTDDVGVTSYVVLSGATQVATATGTSATVSSLTPNTTYSFTVKAKDGAGNTSPASAALAVTTLAVDTAPPSAPTGLTVTGTTSNSVSLSWTASTDNVAVVSYDVYNGTSVTLPNNTTTSATVSGLMPSTAYTFSVKAKDAAGNVSAASASVNATTATSTVRHEAPYPTVPASTCGGWALTDNVCCGRYCSNNDRSEDCSGCGGNSSSLCVTINSKACMSGEWPEVHSVSTSEPWHYSRSTHFGLTSGGACGFGLYGLCTTAMKWTDPNLGAQCDAFCKAYPSLCADPAGTTLRGNFAAPPGNYYTQFWSSLPGDRDNYLACGECYQVIRTKKDGTDYAAGEAGYTAPITLQLIDSCPCSANTKWCCGSGRDHCGEVSDFKYGCQLPPAPPNPPVNHDPLPNESIHLDLSDIAMSRLQTGSATGNMVDGVIPIRYKRVLCPVVGNVYIWLRSGAGPYWFALSVVNVSKLGSVVNVEAQLASGSWVSLVRDQNYTSSRPQERYGTWVVPQGAGPFPIPMSLRITDGAGTSKVATNVINSLTAPAGTDPNYYYIDTGMQF